MVQYGNKVFYRWAIFLVGLSLFSCLDQEVDSLTVSQARRLLAGPVGNKTWLIENENFEITFNVLTSNPSAAIKDSNGVISNFNFQLSQTSSGTFTDTLFFENIETGNTLSHTNIIESLSSLEVKILTNEGVRLKLTNN